MYSFSTSLAQSFGEVASAVARALQDGEFGVRNDGLVQATPEAKLDVDGCTIGYAGPATPASPIKPSADPRIGVLPPCKALS